MTLNHILFFSAAALAAGLLSRPRWRANLLLLGSVLAIYWLQPSTPIRNLDFWLPTATLAVSVLVWAVTRPAETANSRQDLHTGIVLTLAVAGIGLARYLGPLCCLTPTRPPQAAQVLPVVALAAVLIWLAGRFFSGRASALNLISAALLALFIILKTEPLAAAASAWLRSRTGQSTAFASPLDIRWLGFSYVAFRLLHTLRDRLNGRLPGLSLSALVTYVIFFPAFTAGPIDRVQRFSKDLEADFRLDAETVWRAGRRVLLGIFKKFVLADSLALIALSPENALQTASPLWMWTLVYAYALRLYYDFSGYTDIAIGLGQLLGVQLPENFTQPYRKANLTAFWNSWHITLAQWFRAYFFNPLTRTLRSGGRQWPLAAIVFAGQLGTMILIGLWHGVTWNFFIWGLWHGLGLFIHNRWAEFTKGRSSRLDPRLANLGGVLLTFHYVALGWVWFALPLPAQSWHTLQTLLGLAG
ncbi:MAG: hypothetical protein OEZ02_01935 [Anaerolineae bacterium]|nr:hypothetical protein [Anaerolineae bacterium]